MNDDEIRGRLQALGQEPIDEQTRAAHMRRMTAGVVAGESRRRGFVWAGIAAAALVGFLAGSTGLAMADALPDPAQEVAHDVLRVVQVDVPQGKEGKRGPCVAEAAKIKDKDAKKAAKDACPKGGEDEGGDESGDETGTPGQGPPPADDPCRGRPPWAGPMSKQEREAAKQSASRENCPQDEDDSGEAGGQAGPPAQDDPCRGRPPWAGPMSKEQREAAKESASRENCPQDEDDEDADEEADADASADASDAATATESTTTSTTSSSSTTSTTSTTVPAESTETDEPSSGD